MKFTKQFRFLPILVALFYALYYTVDLLTSKYSNMFLLKYIIIGLLLSRLHGLPWTRVASQITGVITKLEIPLFLRTPIFEAYCNFYNIVKSDMIKPLDHYSTINAFFTREVKPRQIGAGVVAPADSKILSISQVLGNDCLLVKKVHYKLGHFLTGNKNYEMQLNHENPLWSCICYLAPGDYHRYHCPVDFTAESRLHIPGKLAPVKESSLRTGLYEGNERVVLKGTWQGGIMYIVFVGATNVGSMTINFDQELKTNESPVSSYKDYRQLNVKQPYVNTDTGVLISKGTEIGKFNLGSTVVLIFEGDLQWKAKSGQKIRYGQTIAL